MPPSSRCQVLIEQLTIGPRLAAGWPVVELAEPVTAGGLGGQPRPYTARREQVEDAELTVAQPLIGDRADAGTA
jgi:hypothetical protein